MIQIFFFFLILDFFFHLQYRYVPVLFLALSPLRCALCLGVRAWGVALDAGPQAAGRRAPPASRCERGPPGL